MLFISVMVEARRSERILNLTTRLVRYPSVESNYQACEGVLDEAAKRLGKFTREKFEKNGARSDLYYVGNIRPNKFRVLLHAHLDVVPAQNDDQYNPRIEEGRLIGRGARDMKSGGAAEIEIFQELASKLPYPIGLSLTTDEETGGFNGAGHQVEEGVRADFVISGESTDFAIGNQHKGVLILELSSDTQGGHTANDGDDVNALLQVIRVQAAATEMYPGTDGTWRTTCSPTNTQITSYAHNTVPGHAEGELALRWIPQDNPDAIQERIAGINEKVKVRRGPFGQAHYTNESNPDVVELAKAIAEVTGQEAVFLQTASSSDVRHWTNAGSAGVDFGPRGVGAHAENEYVEINSLETYASILETFLLSIR
jgi:succinyl-diaminopimelate desuccinylase